MSTESTSLRAAYAKHILNHQVLETLNRNRNTHYGVLPEAPDLPLDSGKPYDGRICIIGAGAAGLYAAMVLKYLGITNVDIFEASDRVGGRLFTKGLSGGDDYHNYYDVGAMRIPQIAWMKHVLDFIDQLGLQSSRQEYVYSNDDVPSSYWYRSKPVDDPKFQNFMGPVVAGLTRNFDLAFANWLETNNDNYSTRSFLMAGPQDKDHPEYSAPIPHWNYEDTATAEIYDTSTGLFDQSITETLIDYADFQAAKDSKWWRVDGGMQRVAEAMQSHLLSTDWPEPGSRAIKVTTGSPVTALSHDKQAKKMSVTVAGGQAVEYDMVFNTTAMGPLQRMDLHGLGLPDRILTGIRSLSYDRATKVVIRFTKPWWCAAPRPKIYGGVSQTDLPISNVVYPSWNDGPDHPAVLMVSYSWAQDATRMASLVRDYTVVAPEKDDPIVTLCLQNLAMLWKDRIKSADLFKDLSDMYMTHHAWAWENDPYTGGAFALFGPGQFKNLYPNFLRLQCDGRFAMCGEALSAHHAWIAGAFDSVYIKMYQFLVANRRIKDIAKLYSSTWFGAGKDAHSEEMDEFLMKHIVALEFPTRQDGEGSEHQQAIVQGMAK